ncbi:arginine/serine-rich protein PNISR [Phlebotomus argentipes]|uniref:arginine/serine-rich protein PNISR n=1 Tax=Phlebotomus argentipes TaxID=94469 RepID=UPI0028930883|nr:arginine/serine-rich protein PNISR [Phlebotomus argentipes]
MFPIDKAKAAGVAREKNYQSTTWSLNPQAYQNVSNDMVDWAALAQQWIQMKETCPAAEMPAAPPPPPLTRSDFEEQGEAPMEVVKEEESSAAQSSGGGGSQWSAGWSSFRPQNQWRKCGRVCGRRATEMSSFAGPGWNSWSGPSIVAPPAAGILRGAGGLGFRNPPPAIAQQLVAPPWPRARFPAASALPAKEDSQVSNSASKSDVNFVQEDTTTTIDAAKRKNLPAWIREGLEKMERDKQRQAEREREEHQRQEELAKRRKAEAEALKALESLKKAREEDVKMPEKSKFESDSDSEADDVFSDAKARQRISNDPKSPETKADVVRKTVEELMLDVRRTLTEILLEVTNEEIQEIANETLVRAQRKKPKVIVAQSSILPVSNLPGKLGLAIYGTSDSEGSDADEEENTQTSGKNDDSDEGNSEDSERELQERIKFHVNAFKKTSREIEQQLAEEEEREERKRVENEEREQRRKLSAASNDAAAKNNGSVERNRDGETEQLDRNSSRSGRSSRPKKQSRFSDPRDTVRGTHLTHVSILGAYKMDPLAPGLPRGRVVSEATAVAPAPSAKGGGNSKSSGRSRRRSVSTSDDDDVSSTSSSNSRRRHRGRSRSSDRHSRHSHSSHNSRRSRSRSRERRSSSSRHGRH